MLIIGIQSQPQIAEPIKCWRHVFKTREIIWLNHYYEMKKMIKLFSWWYKSHLPPFLIKCKLWNILNEPVVTWFNPRMALSSCRAIKALYWLVESFMFWHHFKNEKYLGLFERSAQTRTEAKGFMSFQNNDFWPQLDRLKARPLGIILKIGPRALRKSRRFPEIEPIMKIYYEIRYRNITTFRK